MRIIETFWPWLQPSTARRHGQRSSDRHLITTVLSPRRAVRLGRHQPATAQVAAMLLPHPTAAPLLSDTAVAEITEMHRPRLASSSSLLNLAADLSSGRPRPVGSAPHRPMRVPSAFRPLEDVRRRSATRDKGLAIVEIAGVERGGISHPPRVFGGGCNNRDAAQPSAQV
jgi:hypothetical protein